MPEFIRRFWQTFSRIRITGLSLEDTHTDMHTHNYIYSHNEYKKPKMLTRALCSSSHVPVEGEDRIADVRIGEIFLASWGWG
jgi:hypothetical protein